MVHDLENIGDTTLAFTTVELKLGSANAPLPLARHARELERVPRRPQQAQAQRAEEQPVTRSIHTLALR